jgi:hypothetical protein
MPNNKVVRRGRHLRHSLGPRKCEHRTPTPAVMRYARRSPHNPPEFYYKRMQFYSPRELLDRCTRGSVQRDFVAVWPTLNILIGYHKKTASVVSKLHAKYVLVYRSCVVMHSVLTVQTRKDCADFTRLTYPIHGLLADRRQLGMSKLL